EKNDAGGISGGISTGEDIVIRVAVKPPSSIGIEQSTVTKDKKNVPLKIEGRHDPCIIPRFIPVAESMVAITLVDLFLQHKVSRNFQ
ncbi:chorismate synthase, partial [Candidatus Peregrinibacteria bacterium]|nr:chorismate synthase [Candidatus Peregrinibacteria bacterium]